MKKHMENLHVKCATCSCTCTNQGLSGMLLYDMPRKVCIIQVCIPLVWKGVVWVKVIVNILNVAKGRLDGEGGGDGMWSNFYALFKISYFKIIVKYDMRCLVGKELGVSEFFPTHSQPSQLSQLRREVLNYCRFWLFHQLWGAVLTLKLASTVVRESCDPCWYPAELLHEAGH